MHNDIIATSNGVRKVIDITNPKQNSTYFMQPHKESWHGTMTTVVCAGDGYKRKGLYKGLAPDAVLVLLKVMNAEGHIITENIAKALEWVLKDHGLIHPL
ncbi:MAG: hypothetical protein EKK37_06420 [Sphingobacteriales bacterium]|nr:MAG: hypothetical protein EKK37_06420 [Sphingobacteriales bacterium]